MSHKLLLADGSAAIQRVVELMFSSEDVEVVAVDDGQQAIERLPAERPDVVLADIGTARRSGYEVAAFVKDHPQLSHVPVLLLAGAFEPVDEVRVSQVRSAGVLVKPLEPRAVVSRVRSLVESRRQAPAAEPGRPSRPAPDSAATPAGPRSAGSGSVPPPVSERVASPLRQDDRPVADADGGSLDDYFDRLDAAFATLGARQRPAGRSGPDLPHVDTVSGGADVPTLDGVLGSISRTAGTATPPPRDVVPPPAGPADVPPTLPAAPPPRPAAAPGSDALAELFRLLLAVEQGEADVASVTTRFAAVPGELTDELVERVTRRVVERLGTEAVRGLVQDVVSDVAERLVRQEIDRIRRG